MNPILNQEASYIDFTALNEVHIREAAQQIQQQTRDKILNLKQIPAEQRTFANTAEALDEVMQGLGKVFSAIFLTGYVHPEEAPRKTALEQIPVLDKFNNELMLDVELYRAVKAYANTTEAQGLEGYRKKFLDDTLLDFRRNGLELPDAQRREVQEIQNALSEQGAAFDANIAAYQDSMTVSEAEMEGLPEDYKKAHKQEDGTYKIDLSYPSYRPFMKYAHSGTARKTLMHKFLNRAADKNLEVLDLMLAKRKELADKLGFSSFAHYQLLDKMAKAPENVWAFEQELREKVLPRAKADYQELLEMKRQFYKDHSLEKVHPWENAFLNNLLLKENYQVDQEELKAYFPLDRVIEGLFALSSRLFAVEFEEISGPSVWHSDVRAFWIKKNGSIAGRFYLDLFPRDQKFNHAASFPLVSGRKRAQGYQKPQAALVCNFPRPGKNRPSLLPHDEVVTLFHEFGHLMHDMLTESPLAAMAGTNVSRDFVETPSQLFENWAWEYDSLQLFARHYQTGEPLPKSLHANMLKARNVGSGIATLQQIFYGMLDMTYHNKYQEVAAKGTTAVVKELQERVTLFEYMEDTCFQAGFGHLNGYAAGYYGYLWAKVFAEDIFSAFHKSHVLDAATGKQLRDIVLARGATKDEMQTVRDFLGREPDNQAFLKSLGL